MKLFHIIIIVVAVAILIATTILMYAMFGSKSPLFPPIAANCPDYWSLDANGMCIIPKDNSNMGNIAGHQIYKYEMINQKPTYSRLSKMYNTIKGIEEDGIPYNENLGYYTTDFPYGYDETNPQKNVVDFNHIDWDIYGSGACEKQKWANIHNIAWDGISNYNHCKPPEVNA